MNSHLIHSALLKRLISLVCLAFASHHLVVGQTINGEVRNEQRIPIAGCQVFYLDQGQVRDMSITDESGYFSLDYSSFSDSISLRFIALGYASLDTTLSSKSDALFNSTVTLKTQALVLDEIIVEEKKIIIKERNDTTVYDLGAFEADGSAKLIEALDKLPGVSVDRSTGEVKYRGVSVETILIDGDDLLGKAYSQAIRILPSKVIDRVEGIEDYHQERLRKGIEKSQAVALNLITSNQAKSLNGEIVAGAGPGKHHYLRGDLFSLLGSNKLIATSELNTISVNNTSFSPGTFQLEHPDIQENLAYNPYFNSTFEQLPASELSYDNDLKFGQLQWLRKWENGIRLKVHGGMFTDEFEYEEQQNDRYFSSNEVIEQNTNRTSFSQRQQFFASTDLQYAIDSKQDLSLATEIWLPHTKSNVNLGVNDSLTRLIYSSERGFIKGSLNYQKRLNKTNLLSFNLELYNDLFESTNRQEQVSLPPSLVNLENNRFQLNFTTELAQKTTNGNRSFSLITRRTYSIAHEFLASNEEVFSRNYLGLQLFERYEFNPKAYLTAKLVPNLRSTKFTATETSRERLPFTLDGELSFSQKLGNYSTLSARFAQTNSFLPTQHLLERMIFLPNGSVVNNTIGLAPPRDTKIGITYLHNNVYDALSITSRTYLSWTQNAFFPFYDIVEGIITINYEQLNRLMKTFRHSTSVEWVIAPIEHRAKVRMELSHHNSLAGSIGTSDAPGKVNINEYSAYFESASAFSGPFNYLLSCRYLLNQGSSGIAGQSSLDQLEGSLTLKTRLFSRLNASWTTQIFLNNVGTSSGDIAIVWHQMMINYRIKKDFNIFLRGSNLFGQNAITYSDFSESSQTLFTSSTYGPYLIGGVNYIF